MKKNILFVMILICSFIITVPSVSANENGKVSGDFVSVRMRASSSSSKITDLIYGSNVTIIGEEGSFYKVIYDGLNTGYMSKSYVLKDNEYKLNNPEYCNALVAAGFPASYCPYLSYVHSKHPTWTFTPIRTGLDFYNDVVNGEEGKNCLTTTNDVYRSGTTVCDAGGYYFVNQTVNAYFLDPRNFINEKTIFMFENLHYTPMAQNREGVKSILGSTSFLVTKTDTDGSSYIDYYLGAGEEANVAPMHLASRTKQEGASSESYGPVTGTVTSTLPEYGNRTLYGFYNFYNIGASNGKQPQLNGLAYAAGYRGISDVSTTYGRPWNTRRKAIYGGAHFIGSSYINQGQNTLYLQKFNVNPVNTNVRYTHQYMSNILSPYSEGKSMKSAYDRMSLTETDFNFAIPVYENMPDQTYQPSLLNGNNLLSSINLDGKPLDNFDSDILEYTQYVLSSKTQVSVSAISNSADSKIEGTGNINLPNETNIITIKVTAQNGEVRNYKITIIRVQDTTTVEEVVAKLGVKVNGSYMYGLSVGIDASTIVASVAKISPTASVVISDAAGNVKSGALSTGDKVRLKTLTSAEKTYEFAINGDVNGDGSVDIKDLLRVQKHLLGTVNLAGSSAQAADNNYDGKINVQDLLRIQKYILGSITTL